MIQESYAMRIGIGVILTDQTPPVDVVARLAEDYGFDSLWMGEHSHCPTDTVHNYSRDGRVPEPYQRFLDPFIALTVAACATSRLRLGTSVALPAEHGPVMLAKTVATLDLVSNGRVDFGVGWGWNEPELRNNGVEPAHRRSIMREKIQAMYEIWNKEVFSFTGEHVQITDSWAFPKPVQRPHPPVYLGAAATPRNLRDMATWADGWLPIAKSADSSELVRQLAALKDEFDKAGRHAAPRVTLLETRTNTGPHMTVETFTQRLPDLAQLGHYHARGIERIIISVPVYTIDLYERSLSALQFAYQPMTQASGAD
jgi:probable F420-dependent oxidoreductase